MKKKIISYLLILCLLLCVFSACETRPETASFRVLRDVNIILPLEEVEVEIDADDNMRNMFSMKYNGKSEMLKDSGFKMITQYDDSFIFNYIDNEYLMFKYDIKNNYKIEQFKRNNLWGEKNSFESSNKYAKSVPSVSLPQGNFWLKVFTNRDYAEYNENLPAIFEKFAREELGIDGVCNNVIEDQYRRLIGGILVENDDGFELYAVAMQGIWGDKKCFYEKNNVVSKINLDSYLEELNQFKELTKWNQELRVTEFSDFDNWEFE